ncbi:general odorant-binding protein 72-like [Aphomia sociella]
MNWKVFIWFTLGAFLDVDALTKQQLKNTGKTLRKSCMGKVQVTEDLIRDIDKGTFIEDRNVMCYIACIYKMSQIIKNNKLTYEAAIKQVDLMYPPDMKESIKKSIENCKDVEKKYKDICEASFWTAKCIYEDNPKDFLFA